MRAYDGRDDLAAGYDGLRRTRGAHSGRPAGADVPHALE